MTNGEKKICDIILRDGTIINKDEYMCEGIAMECYTVECDGQKYTMTKHDGEWVYFIRNL